ncbi:hypothetical protein C791_4977 [Amycolatopsis azurea DSM 43854]|uniref:Uncharacterized protein n=1 Tax=Amycolatopsis azurea DSM 43854 TaxID=1238180 RepID=M2QT98_9PSEU|nr:hypothetical protein C791_4977 [Amycolatopsis azurea DSM 43854]
MVRRAQHDGRYGRLDRVLLVLEFHDRLHSTLGYRTTHEARVGHHQGFALVA